MMIILEDLTRLQQDWLTSKESLTQRLRAFTHNKITHHLFYDDWGITDQNQEAWIRRMEWRYENEVWVSCIVVIPETSMTAETSELMHIGKRSIGDILFQDPTLTRSDFVFSVLENGNIKRTSTFYYKNHPIVLVENFFPEFLGKIE